MLRIVILCLALLAAAWWWQGRSAAPHAGSGAAADAATDIATLAASVQAEEVVIYTTSTCTYCAQAMRWLDQQGFAYTECNMSTTPRCEQEFMAHGATGTPYLVVRGHHMKDGFDSDEFLAALR